MFSTILLYALAFSHGTHTHGIAEMKVAMEGKELEIEFEFPAVDIVGFEHQAKKDSDKAKVDQALKKLREHGTIISLPKAAKCQLSKVEADSDLLEEDEEHNDFEAEYEFRCEKMAELKIIKVLAFSHFPSVNKIKAVAVSANGQFQADLTKEKNVFQLSDD